MDKIYINRFVDELIIKKLAYAGAVVVVGPKSCGKTETCMHFQKSYFKLDTHEKILSVSVNPQIALEGLSPHLIDEWQTVPNIWNLVKSNLDNNYATGKFLLTGSSTPVEKTKILHGGQGRFAIIKMRPMSLAESNESSKSISLSTLFVKDITLENVNNDKTLDDVIFYMCRGGWPLAVLNKDKNAALQIVKEYYNSLFMFEESSNKKFRNKKTSILNAILRSYARNISSMAKASTIINDIISNENRVTFDRKTYDDYIEALNDLYIINNIEAWSPNLRSKTAVMTTPTRHFVDTSIACAALNVTPESLKFDFKTLGLLFEDFCVRDLSIYANMFDGQVKHYRDGNGNECDAVITIDNNNWAAIEIKLGGWDLEHEGIKNLLSFRKRILENTKFPPPKFLMVITAFGQPYKSPEGVYVVPITCLTK